MFMGPGQLHPRENTIRKLKSFFFDQNRAEMAGVASIEVCKNWSGIFQSSEIAVAFFKIT
jgi:plasmid maintenance system killer protein